MSAFLLVAGKWFPLEITPTEDAECVAYSLSATLLTQGDEMAEAIERDLDEYAEEMNQVPDEVPTFSSVRATIPTQEIVRNLNVQFTPPPREVDLEFFAPFNGLSPHVMAHIWLQFLGPNPDALGPRDRLAIAEFANVLGPDWAQKFYHFATKVTKLA